MALATQTLKRLIHYYDFLVGYESNFVHADARKPFLDVFKAVEHDIQIVGPNRYLIANDKTFIIPNISINSRTGYVEGRLFSIRGEDFPEVYDLSTAKTRDFDAAENEGIVESSHFVINCNKLNPTVAFEYNQYGAKVTDLGRYINMIAQRKGIVAGMTHRPVVKDDLENFIKRMGRFSKFIVKIHKDRVETVRTIEPGIASMFEETFNQFEGEYATIEIKFDFKKGDQSIKANNAVKSIINSILRNRLNVELFDTLLVTAEDSEANNLLKAFDLLLDKERSELTVQKRGRSRTIISIDILSQMNQELFRKSL